MPKVTYVSASGVATTVEAETGSNLMATALANGIEGIAGELRWRHDVRHVPLLRR